MPFKPQRVLKAVDSSKHDQFDLCITEVDHCYRWLQWQDEQQVATEITVARVHSTACIASLACVEFVPFRPPTVIKWLLHLVNANTTHNGLTCALHLIIASTALIHQWPACKHLVCHTPCTGVQASLPWLRLRARSTPWLYNESSTTCTVVM